MQFKVGSTTLRCTSLEVAVNDLDDGDNSFRTMDGTMMRSVIAKKRQIKVEWGVVTNSAVKDIMTALSPAFFDVTYPDPMSGQTETRQFYCANRSAPVAFERNGILYWHLSAFTLTER